MAGHIHFWDNINATVLCKLDQVLNVVGRVLSMNVGRCSLFKGPYVAVPAYRGPVGQMNVQYVKMQLTHQIDDDTKEWDWNNLRPVSNMTPLHLYCATSWMAKAVVLHSPP